MDYAAKLIELAENRGISWEAIARECIAEMPTNDVRDVCVALGVDGEIECPFDDDDDFEKYA